MENKNDLLEKLVREYVTSESFIKIAIDKTRKHIANKKRYEQDPIPVDFLEKVYEHLREIKKESPKKAFVYLDNFSVSLWNSHGINKSSRVLKSDLEALPQFEVKITGDKRKNAVFIVEESEG